MSFAVHANAYLDSIIFRGANKPHADCSLKVFAAVKTHPGYDVVRTDPDCFLFVTHGLALTWHAHIQRPFFSAYSAVAEVIDSGMRSGDGSCLHFACSFVQQAPL